LKPRINYATELTRLPESYERVLEWNPDELRSRLLGAVDGQAIFVGTGGTLAVARLAAGLHETITGEPARVMTPLELSRLSPLARARVVLFSAGLKHPDALLAVEMISTRRMHPATVVTLRAPAEVRSSVPSSVAIIGLPPLSFSEGFLATTSVLVMACALIRAYLGDDALPLTFPSPTVEMPEPAERLLVLGTPDLAPISVDIETRCNELGIAAVQTVDYRNFAHGRHVGLARNAATTSVLALIAEPFVNLAERTVAVLPADEIDVTTWRTSRSGPIGTVEFLLASMQLAGNFAERQGIEASRPGAPEFGRRLYHLGLRRMIPRKNEGSVDRKLSALPVGSVKDEARAIYEDGLKDWVTSISGQQFSGVVLDYDGTICSTSGRYQLPDETVQMAIARILETGAWLGIASGRGKSLFSDLREWVPKAYWEQVVLGLYNGGIKIRLSEELPDMSVPSTLMLDVVSRLCEPPLEHALRIEARSHQVTATLSTGTFSQPSKLRSTIAALMGRRPALDVAVVTSGHSVDVIPSESSKTSVADEIESLLPYPVLAIGDQGDLGGNDFELLASSRWTLTVDECSPDPTRCWYLDDAGRSGPELLTSYLNALHPDGESLTFETTIP